MSARPRAGRPAVLDRKYGGTNESNLTFTVQSGQNTYSPDLH